MWRICLSNAGSMSPRDRTAVGAEIRTGGCAAAAGATATPERSAAPGRSSMSWFSPGAITLRPAATARPGFRPAARWFPASPDLTQLAKLSRLHYPCAEMSREKHMRKVRSCRGLVSVVALSACTAGAQTAAVGVATLPISAPQVPNAPVALVAFGPSAAAVCPPGFNPRWTNTDIGKTPIMFCIKGSKYPEFLWWSNGLIF